MSVKNYNEKETYSFSEGLRLMSEKGIKGPRVHLTKKRALMLLDFLQKSMGDHVVDMNDKDANDWFAVMQWVRNQIEKRWSMMELHR